MAESFLVQFLLFTVISALLIQVISGFDLLQTLQDTIGRENFTYYRLSKTGDIRIELESLEGDADLFVSDQINNPTEGNCRLYSVTYGVDIVDIPHTFTRPVSIGVYGHSYYETSKYQLRIYSTPPSGELTYEQLYEKFHKYRAPEDYDHGHYSRSSHSTSAPRQSKYDDYDEEEESEGSLLWQILLTLLKVIFEVIL